MSIKSIKQYDATLDFSKVMSCLRTAHMENDRAIRTENFEKEVEKDSKNGHPVQILTSLVVDTGHPAGLEIHNITSNGCVIVLNKNKFENNEPCLVTMLLARPGQINRYYNPSLYHGNPVPNMPTNYNQIIKRAQYNLAFGLNQDKRKDRKLENQNITKNQQAPQPKSTKPFHKTEYKGAEYVYRYMSYDELKRFIKGDNISLNSNSIVKNSKDFIHFFNADTRRKMCDEQGNRIGNEGYSKPSAFKNMTSGLPDGVLVEFKCNKNALSSFGKETIRLNAKNNEGYIECDTVYIDSYNKNDFQITGIQSACIPNELSEDNYITGDTTNMLGELMTRETNIFMSAINEFKNTPQNLISSDDILEMRITADRFRNVYNSIGQYQTNILSQALTDSAIEQASEENLEKIFPHKSAYEVNLVIQNNNNNNITIPIGVYEEPENQNQEDIPHNIINMNQKELPSNMLSHTSINSKVILDISEKEYPIDVIAPPTKLIDDISDRLDDIINSNHLELHSDLFCDKI